MKKKKALKLYKDKEGNIFKPHEFMVEDHHPAVGRIMIIDDRKYKIMDDYSDYRQGTFIKLMNDEDEELIKEYDKELEKLSEKLVEKVDLKRLIKEQIKKRTPQDIKTGLYILKQEDKGAKVEVEHSRECYHFKMYYKGQEFSFSAGSEVDNNIEILH